MMRAAALLVLAAALLVLPASAAPLPPLVDEQPTVFVSGRDGLLYAEVAIGRANPYQVWLLAGNELLGAWYGNEVTAAPMLALIPSNYGVGAGRVLNVCRLWSAETHAIRETVTRCTTVATDPIRLYLPAVAR